MSNLIELNVGLGERSYPIYIDSTYNSIGEGLKKADISGKLMVVTDRNVNKYYGDALIKHLENFGFTAEKYILEPGEKSKNLKTIEYIYKRLIELNFDRKSTLIAFGGGVVGDITGFAASTYLRGVNYVQVPTSLLGQVDSSVGGKTGVDFEGAKNVVGSFYQPKLVFINAAALKTLPIRELKTGLAEVIKHGIIQDSSFFNYIDNNIGSIFNYNEDILKHLVKMNCLIKARVVEEDEREIGLREILNFGHTIGHAIESVSEFQLLHGECVSIGIVGACKLAQYMGILNKAPEVNSRIKSLLTRAGLPVSIKEALDSIDDSALLEQMVPKNIYGAMSYDKKVRKGKLLFVLPLSIGSVTRRFVDDKELIMKVIQEIM